MKITAGRRLLILCIPAIFLALVFTLSVLKGPFWLGSNFDPDYAYLLNGLNLAEGHAPGHVDHPGTPVQVLCSWVISGAAMLSGHGSTDARQADVLARPEFYLCVTRNMMIGVYVLLLIVAGGVVLWRTGSALRAVAIQLPALLAPQIPYAMTTVKPEPLMLCVGMLIAIGAVVYLECEFKNRNEIMAVVFGGLIGLGLAAKITFIPVLFLPLLILERNVSRMLYLVCIAGAFYVATMPMHSRWDVMVNWFSAMLLNSGQYGGGAPGVVDVHSYLPALSSTSALELSLTLMLLSNVALLICARRMELAPLYGGTEPTADSQRVSGYRRCVFGLTLVEACQLAMVAKHPWGGAARYLVPALGLLGLNLFAAATLIPALPAKWNGHAHKTGIALLGCVMLFQAARQIQFGSKLSAQIAAETAMAAKVETGFSNSDVAGFYPSSSPLYALQFGNRFASAAFSEPLRAQHPNAVFYNQWWMKFMDFRGAIADATVARRISERKLFIHGPAVVLDTRGEPISTDYFPKGVQLEPVFSTPAESLYRVVRWPLKQP